MDMFELVAGFLFIIMLIGVIWGLAGIIVLDLKPQTLTRVSAVVALMAFILLMCKP